MKLSTQSAATILRCQSCAIPLDGCPSELDGVQSCYSNQLRLVVEIPRSTLAGGFNPLKNISKNGNLPEIGVKIKMFETTT